MKPLIVDMPYPKIENIQKNQNTAALIYPLYSGSEGELNAILQYVFQSFYFDGDSENDVKKVLNGIALAEMMHLEMLGDLLYKLGVAPAFFNTKTASFYCANGVQYAQNKKKMILDDISSELKAINDYSNAMCKIGDSDVSALLARIRMDEDLHVLALKEILGKL